MIQLDTLIEVNEKFMNKKRDHIKSNQAIIPN